MKSSRFNPLRLLNSVPFGILLMGLTAVFIACGSARPWFREIGADEWPILRDWFDKTDLQFFNAWPLKTLMFLLVANLVVVTWRRIPLTPPRYGVWCIHAGIITLICGTAFYYHYKVEGRVKIYIDPSLGPAAVTSFYDKDERSLYTRVGREQALEYPMPLLPRFKEYDLRYGNADALARRGLKPFEPTVPHFDEKTNKDEQESLSELIGVHGKLTFNVTGFFPYAKILTDFNTTSQASKASGVEATLVNGLDQHVMASWWLVGSDPRYKTDEQHTMDLTHVDATDSMVAVMSEAATKLFRLDVIIAPDAKAPVTLYVQIGKSYPVGNTGYTLQIESYQPGFPMFGTGEPVDILQMLVTSPKQKYRRMVIQDKSVQTDFKLNDPTAGPMGARQKTPLDPALQIDFHVNDPYRLLPNLNTQEPNSVKHTLLTPPGGNELVDIVAGIGSVTSEVHRFAAGTEDLALQASDPGMAAPFAHQGAVPNTQASAAQASAAQASTQEALTTQAITASTTQPAGQDQPPASVADDQGNTVSSVAEAASEGHSAVKIHLQRRDHLTAVDSIQVIPPAARDKDAEDEGVYQVAKVHVALGDWSTDVYAPFADDAGERLPQDGWVGGYFTPPGAIAPLRLQLGNRRRPLPVRLGLDSFKLVPYPGALADNPNAMMKDFISTVTLTDPESGDSYTDKAQMNHPIYFDHGSWLFFQAAYDASGGHVWTRLGVGNRPGTTTMVAGCFMIFAGLAYAFYAKPIIIRRMKDKAIADAVAAGKMAAKPEQELAAR